MFSFLLLPTFLLSYLLGSISSAILICKFMKLPDPRTEGSKNPGATNVMRLGGKKAAYLTFLGDFLKGFLPILIIKWLLLSNLIIETESLLLSAAAIGAFIGHLYPIFFGFKGGKGVATFVGIITGLNLVILIAFILIWIGILFISNYVSLASIVSSILVTLVAWLIDLPFTMIITLAFLSCLVLIKHYSNIKNLINGTEKSFKKKTNSQD